MDRYTTVDLMKEIFVRYRAHLCGTVSLRTKKTRTGADFPFSKFTTAAIHRVNRGYMRRATKLIYEREPCDKCKGNKCSHRGRVLFAVQGLVWKDRKLVGFLSNVHQGKAGGNDTVERYVKSLRRRKNFQSHKTVQYYSQRMGAVDRMDRAVRDWGISRRGVSVCV